MPLVRRPGWLIGSAITVAATSVRAQPTLEVTESGACPNRAELVEALEARHLGVGGSGWKLGLRSLPGAAVLRLDNVAGQVVLERELRSVDCPAMAAAFALMVEAYFVEIGVIAAPGSEPPRATPSPEAPAARTASGAAAPTAPVPAGPTRASPPGPRPELSLAVGPELLLPSPVVTMAADAGFGLNWSQLSLRLALLTTLPSEIRVDEDRVWRWANRAELRAGVNLGGIEPWVGGGVTAVQLQARALPLHPVRAFWSPLVGAGIAARQRFTSFWAGRVGLGCYLPLRAERYAISDVDIGPGPLFGCDLTYGVVWSRFR
jgi:hypothetical protein